MTNAIQPEILAAWDHALNSPMGIWMRSPDITRLKSVLYTTRQWIINRSGDDRLMSITINTSVTDPKNEIWLVRRSNPAPRD